VKVTLEIAKELLNDETGSGVIEYVLLAALVALATVAALHNFDKKMTKDYNKIAKKV